MLVVMEGYFGVNLTELSDGMGIECGRGRGQDDAQMSGSHLRRRGVL